MHRWINIKLKNKIPRLKNICDQKRTNPELNGKKYSNIVEKGMKRYGYGLKFQNFTILSGFLKFCHLSYVFL